MTYASDSEAEAALASDADRDVGWPLGSLELPAMRAVWRRGCATVREVLDDIAPSHPVAYTTVMTVLSRLTDKGLLRRRLRGKTHYYAPTLTPEEFAAHVSHRLLHSLMAEFGELAISQFAAELERVDLERLSRLRAAATRQATG